MNRTFVIFNPAARGEKARRARQFLAGVGATLLPTQAPGHARQLAAQAVAEGARCIVAAGGDGTINEIVNGMDGAASPLGILPLGTANVFARELRIPLNLRAAWDVVEAGRTRTVDLGCAEAAGQPQRFVQLAGVGFDAMAVRAVNWKLKKKLGPLSYVWAGLRAQRDCRTRVEVLVDGAVRASGKAVLIGNGRLYGGWFQVFPNAQLEDGRLDVCVFENCRYLDLWRYMQAVVRGAHGRLPDVQCFPASQFECRAAAPVPFEADGELAGECPVRFSVQPGALQVLAP